MKTVRVIVQIAFSLLALGVAAGVAWWLLKSAPKTTPEPPAQAAKIVQVVDLAPTNEHIVVTAWGTVVPAREVTMEPQVSGRVVAQNPALVPGGLLTEGEELLRIDRAEYELALVERTADLEQAKFESDIERGRQVIAEREWDLLKDELPQGDSDPSLALRKPHLRLTEAMINKAENAIAKAQLDLERTTVRVPFNAMVVEESVEIGQLLDSGSSICRLVGTDAFWVQVTLPMAELARIRLPTEEAAGAAAAVHLDSGGSNGPAEPWSGAVIRLLPDLEANGRMARLLVEVEDPLGLAGEGAGSRPTPLLLGSYVRADLQAGDLEGVLSIPRSALREGNRVWLVGAGNTLRIVPVEILWTRAETVLVDNVLQAGERLVVSDLRAALPGMKVSPQLLGADEPEGSR